MKALLRLGFCCLLATNLMMAQRGGGGHGGGGGRGFGGGGGGRGFGGGGFRGGFGGGRGFGFGGGRGFGFGRGFWGGPIWPGFWGWGLGAGFGGGVWGSPWAGYWDDPYAYDPSAYAPSAYAPPYPAYTSSYQYNPSPNVTVIYPANPGTPPIYTGPVQPVMRTYDQYGQEVGAESRAGIPQSSSSPIYLIAAKDQSIRAAAAYWVDGHTLHYVTLQREEKQISLDSVDRDFTMQLNRERRVPFQLPQ
jgi:hypothetical protein